jgi:hypothetical protein
MEISWKRAEWAAAPPVLTMLPNSGGRALLTGGRPRALLWPAARTGAGASGLLAEIADDMDLWIDEVTRMKAPTCVLIACNEPDEAQELARRCSIAFSYSVSDQLAAMLPALNAYERFAVQGGLPEGFPVARFDTDGLSWIEVDAEDAADRSGLYRCRTWTDQVHVLVRPHGTSHRVPRDFGIFEVLRWDDRDVLVYDPESMELWVPSFARLPLLHERAAVLASGQLPRSRTLRDSDGYDHFGHFYVNVKQEVAERIAASLCQRLDVT